MGRLTVSLPDALEQRLDAYARDQGIPVSHVVARALELFLESPAPPPSPGSEDREARAYLGDLADHVAVIRDFLEETAGWISGPLNPLKDRVPKAIHPPPWRVEG